MHVDTSLLQCHPTYYAICHVRKSISDIKKTHPVFILEPRNKALISHSLK